MEPKRKLYILLTRFPGKSAIAIHALTRCYYTHASIGLEKMPGMRLHFQGNLLGLMALFALV